MLENVVDDDPSAAGPGLMVPNDDDPPSKPMEPIQPQADLELDANLQLTPCKCGCIASLSSENKQQVAEIRKKLAADSKALLMFNLIKASSVAAHGSSSSRAWVLLGLPMCREGFRIACGISNKFLVMLTDAVNKGLLEPPEDMRKYNGSNDKHVQKELDADSFFSYIYQYLSETVADAARVCQELAHKGDGSYILEWVQAPGC